MSLILVMNCILLIALVGWYIGCKNVQGMNNVKRLINIWVPINKGISWQAEKIPTSILSSVDRASLHNLVNETNLVHDLFLVYFVNFIYNLYMFRTSPAPSSGGTTVFMRHLVLVILYAGAYTPAYKSAIQNNKYQMLHKYSCSSWWWTWRGPKHVE